MTSEMKTLGGAVYFSDSQAKDRYGLNFNMSQAEDITFTATYGGGLYLQTRDLYYRCNL